MTEDLFAHWDGAYVLGALSPAEREAFEEHLLTCAACQARLDEIASIPALLGDLTAADFQAAPEPVPDTLLPRLLRAADIKRRRSRTLVAGLVTVAAAAVAALVVVLSWPGSSSHPSQIAARPMHALATSPVSASVSLVAKDGGTEVDVTCRYRELGSSGESPAYWLVVFDRNHTPQSIGSWQLTPGRQETFPSHTSLSPSEISRVEIQLENGTQVLYLDV